MNARALLAKLRQGHEPDPEELSWMAAGLADGAVTDAQAGAFAMALCMGGLSTAGRVALTEAMRDSGRVLHWDLDGPVLDKHSTGGVGDCVSLVLAPALAACGAYVPMISGRGLGHTGGTLDKLEAIPGVSTQIDVPRLHDIVRDTGCAIVGATADIAPADRRLYRVRDVTATVESLDLITASILSKKLAAGLHGLVLDVKVGSGAFMKTEAAARALAEALTQTANAAGCPTRALLSDMNQPLVPSLGNALEVAEVMTVLTKRPEGPPIDLAAALGGAVLTGAGVAADAAVGAEMVRAAITSGAAAERFGKMLAALGGPVQFVETWQRFLPEAPVIREVKAASDGIVTAIDGEALGLTVVALGGGRQRETDAINPAVGLSEVVRLGTSVKRGAALAVVHAARPDHADTAARAVQAAITLGTNPAPAAPLILDEVG
ncbi:MAG: thymidine phosphorylase [Pseudomonadota bacterium]